MHQNQGGYGPPPPQGYPQQQPPPKKGMSGLTVALLIFAGLFVVLGGSCLVCVAAGTKKLGEEVKKSAEVRATGGSTVAAATPARTAPTQVDIKTLLADYEGNEVRADGLYKDRNIRTTGKVNNIKKDIVGGMFVTVGTGKEFEIPEVQCSLNEENQAKAASLNKGQSITVEGKVTGLMMNVQITDCDIL